ncbi:response regulator transcription factor [Bradyrhizobium sp.]
MTGDSEQDSIVYVVDDDASLRDALKSLVTSVGMRVEAFSSAAEFLQRTLLDIPSCLVLDVRLPGISGLDFQTKLAEADMQIPIIIMTGHGDVPMSVKAMKAGAIDFLTKPFRDQDLLDAIQHGLERDRARREVDQTLSAARVGYTSLTPRERQVMALVVHGLMNKQIAAEIGVSEITVKVHRHNIMRKMNVRSLAGLVRIAERLGIEHPSSGKS